MTAISYSSLTGNYTRFAEIPLLLFIPQMETFLHFSSVPRKRWHSFERGWRRAAVPWWVNIHYPPWNREGRGNVRGGGESGAYDLTVSKGREIDPGDLCPPPRGGKSQTSTPVTGSFLYRYQEKILRSLDRVRLTFSRDTPFVRD